ncbi:MAG: hypothetical protein ACRDPT_01595 [Streptomycetales bacterium]
MDLPVRGVGGHDVEVTVDEHRRAGKTAMAAGGFRRAPAGTRRRARSP